MPFMMEKEYEPLLELESREIAGRDGTLYRFTMPKIYWRSFDTITKWKRMSPRILIESADTVRQRTGERIEDIFPNVVWAEHDYFHNKLGVDTGMTPPPRPPTLWRRPNAA